MELFGKPIFFIYFLFAALAAGAIWLAGNKLKNRAINAFFGPQAYAKLTGGLRLNHKLNAIFFFTGLFFLFTALARPQWGTEVIQAEGKFAQTVIAVDVSSSDLVRVHVRLSSSPVQSKVNPVISPSAVLPTVNVDVPSSPTVTAIVLVATHPVTVNVYGLE